MRFVVQLVDALVLAAFHPGTTETELQDEPNLNERVPQFLITDSQSEFEHQANNRLRYLTEEQKSFVEQMQPYHGNGMLSLLGEDYGPKQT